MENPSCLSHVSIGTNDFGRARAFYDAVLPTVGCRVVMEHEGAVAYGKAFPEFWVQVPIDGEKAQSANGIHISFLADTPAQVDDFFHAAIAAGATDDGPPGLRKEYGAGYYGAFVRDLDGHKIEAMHWDEAAE